MTTIVAPPVPAVPRTASPYRHSFSRSLRSEWIKLATLRSTWWSIALVAFATVGIAMLSAQLMAGQGYPPAQYVVGALQLTMLLAGILGTIAVTGEYSTGMIRSTLTADPKRGSVLAAKMTMVAALLFVSSLVIFLLAAVAISPLLQGQGESFPWAEPGEWMPQILTASAAMAVFALLGASFGFVIRSGAGAIAATVGLLFVLPVVLGIFSMPDHQWEWLRVIANHLPSMAATSAISPTDGFGLSQVEGYVALGAWAVAGIAAGWISLRSRDA